MLLFYSVLFILLFCSLSSKLNRIHRNNGSRLILTGNFNLYAIIKHRFEVNISRQSAVRPVPCPGHRALLNIFYNLQHRKKETTKEKIRTPIRICTLFSSVLVDFSITDVAFRVSFLSLPDIGNFMPHCGAHRVIIILSVFVFR